MELRTPIHKLRDYLLWIRAYNRVNLALSRAAATAPLRQIDPTRPHTWAFSGFSQNGEDGITDYLMSRIQHPNRQFVEIGASDGIENNSAWLAIALRWSGLMVEGNAKHAARLQQLAAHLCLGLRAVHMFVDASSVHRLMELARIRDPDFFSLDIDGNDYYLARGLLEAGLRPKVCVVEYNASFGPERAVTIAYRADFDYVAAHPQHLYFGASIAAWRKLFAAYDYAFLTTERNGANAYFLDPAAFERDFVQNLRGEPFHENFAHVARVGKPWADQSLLLQGYELVNV